jgi:uncharacterized delta-60 repeat protein
MRNKIVVAASIVVLCAHAGGALGSCFVPSTPNDGYFDQTWGGSGFGCVAFDGDNTDSTATSALKKIVPNSDGSLVLGGDATGVHGNDYWWLGEIDASGAFVPTFGDSDNSGRITECTLKTCGSLGFTDFALQTDNKISVLNTSYVTRTTAEAHALDTAGVTGGTGSVFASFTIASPGGTLFASDYQGSGIAIAPGGKTFAVGFGYPPSVAYAFFGIARLSGDLSVDASFNAGAPGPGGITYAGGNFIDMGTTAEASQIFQQSDGKLILAGSNGYRDILIARLKSDGSLDPTYNSTGVQFFSHSSVPGPGIVAGTSVHPALVDRAGRVVFVLTGYSGGYYGALVTRFKADGTQDMSWNQYAAGWVLHNVFPACTVGGFQPSVLRPLAIDSAGRILIFGVCDSSQIAVIRLRGDTGALDTSWGIGGMAHGHFDTSGTADEADAIAFDQAGHLFISGATTISGSPRKAAVARLTYDLINTNSFEAAPRGCLPPDCN